MNPNIVDYDHCSATVIADSIRGDLTGRVTTFLLRYPRFIHPQMMTHRMSARNAQSSRAVPVQRMIDQVLENPVTPIAFLSNQRGMVGGSEVPDPESAMRKWIRASRGAAQAASALTDANVHKQHANRVLEPFLTISSVFTFEDKWLKHFYGLRMEHDAQPEIQNLAERMHEAAAKSAPSIKQDGSWHLPFMTPKEMATIPGDILPACSAARCARASYLNFDGKREQSKDEALFKSLVNDLHMSPLEHVLMPSTDGPHGVFEHWKSLRAVHEAPMG